MVRTRQWVLAKKPTEYVRTNILHHTLSSRKINPQNSFPELDGADRTFQLVETDLPELKDNEVLLKLKYLSNDPAQRGWISPYANLERLYVPLVQPGDVMRARGLAEVVESKSALYKKGDEVIGSINWSEYTIIPATELRAAADLPGGMSKTHYLGALGITGLTAYFGLTEVVKAKAKDTVVVSGAAGATGMMAVQIAKNIIGCKKVIGIAGSDDKCRWVESLGADLCLNCKSTKNNCIDISKK